MCGFEQALPINFSVDAVAVLMNHTSEDGRRGGGGGTVARHSGSSQTSFYGLSFVSERQVVTESACRRPYGDWAEAHECPLAGNFRWLKRGDETVTAVPEAACQGKGLLDTLCHCNAYPDNTCHGKARPDGMHHGICHLDAAWVLRIQSVKAKTF